MGCTQSEISPQNEGSRSKSCTDVLWLVIYVIFWIVMLIVAVISVIYGRPLKIINGADSFGNICGVQNNQEIHKVPWTGINTYGKNYVFFMNAQNLRNSLQICVKECPTKSLQTLSDIQKFYNDTGSNLCRYDVLPSNIIRSSAGDVGPCPKYPVSETVPVLHRCIPKSNKTEKKIRDFTNLLSNWDIFEQTLSDVYSSWKEIIICVIIAFICSLIMVSILHLLASLVSWIFMIIVSIVSIIGTVLLWYTYHELKSGSRSFSDTPYLMESLKDETAFLWYSIIATIITVIILVLVWVMRSRVSFLAALFKETAHCLGSIPALFLQPIITFVFLVLFFAFWLFVVMCMATANYPGIPPEQNYLQNGSQGVQPMNEDKLKITFSPMGVKSMWWLCLISLIWGSEFILGCQQMTIAGAVSHWYFRGPNANPSPVLYSIGKLLKYHLGSVAKGSFLITLFKVPRLILTYLHAKLETQANKGSDCAKCGLKCCICCFYCLEKFIRYLNHNAYTIITIERCHFCKAAAKAFNVIINNALQVATINSVGDFILFLGKCIVTAVTGIIGLLLLKRSADLHLYAVPMLLICVFAFFIAHCILSLYEMVVDTLFICVCEDRNLNSDGQWKNSRLAELGMSNITSKRENQDEGAEVENLPTEKF